MKITSQKINNFIKNIPIDIKIILLYGTDFGLISTLSNEIKISFLENKVSSETVISLDAIDIIKEPSILNNHIYSNNMFSDITKKIIVITNSTATLTKTISENINNIDSNTLLVLLSEELTPSNSLRKLAESSNNIAVIACYHDNKENLKNYIKTILNFNNYEITIEALNWLSENLGNDRLITQQEINKLMLYKNNNLKIEILDVIQVISNNSDLVLNDIINLITLGKQIELYPLLKQFLLNFPAIIIIRALNNNFKRLLLAKLLQKENNLTINDIASKLKPPVLFMNLEAFKQQFLLWNINNINLCLKKLVHLEINIKNNINLSELLLNKFTLDIYMLLLKNK